MTGMKSCSLEYKASESRETINKKRLAHGAENAIEQESNNPFGVLI